MPLHTLFRRWRAGTLVQVAAESPAEAVELAARAGVSLAHADLKDWQAPRCFLPAADLRGADLTGARLPGAYLRRADLRNAVLAEADLAGASLRQADLRRADLRNVDLRRADLRGARFTGADLRGARLTGARLDGAVIDWRRAAFPVELLRRDRDCRDEALALLLELAMEADDRPFAWLRAVIRRPGLSAWAGSVLGRAILPGDDAPEALRLLAAAEPVVVPKLTTTDAPPVDRFYWARAVKPKTRGIA